MQDIEPTHAQDAQAEAEAHAEAEAGAEDAEDLDEGLPVHRTPAFRRFLFFYLLLLALLLLALLPPLISVNRLQRRIATSIGDSLGRPVHLDRVSLNLLPLPGFTLENFVVSEDPAFGAEPVIRANTVRADLRVSSLWRRRVEFSTISLADPSVNLVHTADGRWNVESILLQASRIPTAPTAQKSAGAAPRFPYIEATGARLNIKLGQEKIPFSFTEADFALWLPNPREWRLRLTARPVRTDTGVSDTGSVSLEGTLKRAASLTGVPIDITAQWRNLPLGQASRILSGEDAGWRGDMSLSASVTGTMGQSIVHARLQANGVRRAEFVPDRLLAIDAGCIADASALFHSFTNMRCSWPPETTTAPDTLKTLAVTGTIPDIHQLESGSFSVGTPGIPASALLDWLRILTPRIPADASATGILTGSLTYAAPAGKATSAPAWAGQLTLSGASLASSALAPRPIDVTRIALQSPSTASPPEPRHRSRRFPTPQAPRGAFLLTPIPLDLGARDPATLEGSFDAHGCTLHLFGMVLPSRVLALAQSLPQFGDGLAQALPASPPTQANPSPVHIDLTATRAWGGPQTWTATQPHSTQPSKRRPVPATRRPI